MSIDLYAMLERLKKTPAMRSKQAIQHPARTLHNQARTRDALYALPGDDTAAIRCGDQYQLLAIEGMLPAFVEQAPWFAGWSAVMVSVISSPVLPSR